jgi:predicted Rossmann fold flavoprotein
MRSTWDVIVVGAGAAGLATAIFTRRRRPDLAVLLLDGARKPGAKILVSGGGRCNVTNAAVDERDYWGGSRAIIRRVLRGLPVADTIDFFADAGVPLHEEHGGKLFPDSNSARQVLDALLAQALESGAELRSSHRVSAIRQGAGGFTVSSNAGELTSQLIVLATGGQSLPKSGSDGGGYELARALGHTIVATTPALAPLLLAGSEGGDGGDAPLHAQCSGIAQDVILTLWADGGAATAIRGSMLWTHFGISGPAALDLSRHWLRARLDGRQVAVTANLAPDHTYESLERSWIDQSRSRPRALLVTVLSTLVPSTVAAGVLARIAIDPSSSMASLTRDTRRRISHAVSAWPLPVAGSRGYNFAEATAGGVALREIDPSSMASRRCHGLYLVGEMLDVDGRLGGFNFQWAWSSAAVAASGIASALPHPGVVRISQPLSSEGL